MNRLNRHAMKRKHIREQEKKYAKGYCYGRRGQHSISYLRDKLREEAAEDNWYNRRYPKRNGGWEYWKSYYLTGPRQFAKKCTDRRIRQKYRQIIHHYDPEDVTAPHGADYEKEYDYAWTIW